MKSSTNRKNRGVVLVFSALLLATIIFTACQESEQIPKQETFSNAEDAIVAMVDALKANDENRLVAIFGPEGRDAMSSGDGLSDQYGREMFIAAYHERCVLVGEEETKTLRVGSEDWPFPIPLVKEAAGWRFDTAAGIEELYYRRIGRNELATIGTCEAYVAAQTEYAQLGHDGKPAGIYAQKIVSDPGKQNGLYWQVNSGEEESPLGALAAEASAEGYTRSVEGPTPFRGYFFRILTAQGASAESYLVDGEMRKGFALVAWPAEYGKSAMMTFVVNQNGIVYEKDLGDETAKLVEEMKAYNLDNTWNPVNSPEQ